ncbi:NADH dehydrogenase [ubiquinone] 1 alpha subcomplex subunit 8 [Cimex lectularius]|uniref:NADH dehydrogenase [ubiquinone] 1 alpha subcomplex subunit 8 n=1 Tax=Cimex lectularius TaxID=79782 RepID=A0A8I6S7T9_CIMLE|nr:NADH dehydrogenase [ubiquinone] 1 alpha subcomplex subunit 8 [Cimex lectularius]
MVVSYKVDLPTEEELTVPEVNLSSAVLRAAAFHLGKYCENVNNEFMLCRSEYPQDPRQCIQEGKEVTACSLGFFQKMKQACRQEFEIYTECIDKSSTSFDFAPCRKTQGVYDKCMLDKLNIERPHFGYFCEARIHDSSRPKPQKEVQVLDDPIPSLPPDYKKTESKYQGRHIYS